MTKPAEREAELIEQFSVVEDPSERLSLLVDYGRRAVKGLAESERREADLVPGCSSRLWLVGTVESRDADDGEALARFCLEADSTLVQGLAGLLVSLYDGARLEDVRDTETRLIEALGLHHALSPTRLRGLAQVRGRVKAIAEAWLRKDG